VSLIYQFSGRVHTLPLELFNSTKPESEDFSVESHESYNDSSSLDESPLTDLLEQIEAALQLRNPKLRSSLLTRAQRSTGLSSDRFACLVHLFQTEGCANVTQ